MTIKVKGTVVINDNRDIDNVRNLKANGQLSGDIIATENQATKGENNTSIMTPLRVKQAIEAILATGESSVIKSIQRGSQEFNSGSYDDEDRPDGWNPQAPTTYTVSISAVNLDKSVVIAQVRSRAGGNTKFMSGPSNYFPYSINGSASARLTSSDTLTITTGNPDVLDYNTGWEESLQAIPQAGILDWQVIEYV